MLIEVRMVKRVKYLISDKAEVYRGTEEYDLGMKLFHDTSNSCDNDNIIIDANLSILPIIHDNSSVATEGSLNHSPGRTMSATSLSSARNANGGLNARSNLTPKKMDFMEMMVF